MGTKTDLRKDAEFARKTKLVTAEQGQLLASELGAYRHCECSALTQARGGMGFGVKRGAWTHHDDQQALLCLPSFPSFAFILSPRPRRPFGHNDLQTNEQEGLKPVFDEAIRCVLEHQNKPQKKKNKCVVC